MDEKYVVIKEYDYGDGVIPIGTEIYDFRGGIYVNGLLLPKSYYEPYRKAMEDRNYTKKIKIEKNEF